MDYKPTPRAEQDDLVSCAAHGIPQQRESTEGLALQFREAIFACKRLGLTEVADLLRAHADPDGVAYSLPQGVELDCIVGVTEHDTFERLSSLQGYEQRQYPSGCRYIVRDLPGEREPFIEIVGPFAAKRPMLDPVEVA